MTLGARSYVSLDSVPPPPRFHRLDSSSRPLPWVITVNPNPLFRVSLSPGETCKSDHCLLKTHQCIPAVMEKNNPKSSCNIQPHSLADSLPSLSLHHTLYFSYPLLLMLLKNHCPFVPLPVILATQHSPTDPFWTPPYPESQMVLVSGNLNHSIAPVISYMPLTVHSHLCEQEDLSVSYTWSDT